MKRMKNRKQPYVIISQYSGGSSLGAFSNHPAFDYSGELL